MLTDDKKFQSGRPNRTTCNRCGVIGLSNSSTYCKRTGKTKTCRHEMFMLSSVTSRADQELDWLSCHITIGKQQTCRDKEITTRANICIRIGFEQKKTALQYVPTMHVMLTHSPNLKANDRVLRSTSRRITAL